MLNRPCRETGMLGRKTGTRGGLFVYKNNYKFMKLNKLQRTFLAFSFPVLITIMTIGMAGYNWDQLDQMWFLYSIGLTIIIFFELRMMRTDK